MDHGDAVDLLRTPTPRALASGVLAWSGGDVDAAVALLCGAIRVLRGLPDTRADD